MPVETLNGQCPPQTPENSVIDNNQFFEDLLQLRTKYRLRQRYINLPSEDRISPPQEPQEPVRIDHTKHLDQVSVTRQAFNAELGIPGGKRILSCDPVFDIVNMRLAVTPEQRAAVIENIKVDEEKNLRERYHAAVSVVKYILDENGVAYGENCSEPADWSFRRGALERVRQGSGSEREFGTVEGGIKAKKKLADPATPLHSKMVVISGPDKDSVYTDNFVDIYESDLDPLTGKKIIVMTRFAAALSYDEYKSRAIHLKPDYLNGATGSIDAYFLSNPIFFDSGIDTRNPHELFKGEFAYQKEAIGEKDFQEIYQVCLPFILNYIDVLCSGTFNPTEIAVAFNAILNKGDAIRKEIINKGKKVLNSIHHIKETVVNTFKSVKEEAAHLGRQMVEEIMAGCGLSGGFSIGSSSGGILATVGSLISKGISAIRGLFGKDKDYCIHCGACGEEIKCVVRKGESCPKCNAVRRC